MYYDIIQASDLTLHLLKTRQDGFVHSVYRKTVNLCIDKTLIALQSNASPLSPISLIADLSEESLCRLNLSEGTPVRVTDTSLLMGSFRFLFQGAKPYSSCLQEELTPAQISLLKEHLAAVLLSSHTGGFDAIFHAFQKPGRPLPSPILEGGRQYLLQARQALSQKEYSSASVCLSRLLGLGIGLTPSGDDFLCGVLAGLILSGNGSSSFASLLKEQVAAGLHRTNTISQAFLRCALNHRFSPAVLSLAKCPDPGAVRASFETIGHSSGIDTLYGIFFILDFIENGRV